MRIAIVNDSAMAVEALRRAILSAPGHQLAWVACNGADAVAQCIRDRPDLILMDLIMPIMDGVEATRRIMAESPCPILVVTATVQGNSAKVFEALGAGALDAVSTPALQSDGTHGGVSSLLFKIASLSRVVAPEPARPLSAATALTTAPVRERLIVIGASAGGPAALAAVLAGLPRDMTVAVAIVQHLDAQFAPGLASWLSGQSTWPVRIANDGDSLQGGTVLVAGADKHLVLQASGKLGYTDQPIECSYRPSIDVFFQSVQRHWKGPVAGVLLTGMGRDGALGLKTLRASGAYTIAQSREGCVVYGMPKAAVELNAASAIVALEQIPASLTRYFASSPERERK